MYGAIIGDNNVTIQVPVSISRIIVIVIGSFNLITTTHNEVTITPQQINTVHNKISFNLSKTEITHNNTPGTQNTQNTKLQ